ncbi:MAG: CDP-alcohol phosphatidyltransferase family protein [Planctomycetota bacterium]|nr:CDP-alcohol phosphatidyltransferase family protein [Planctomycetota bacterium]
MIGRAVAFGFCTARDFVARGLLRLHVGPDAMTLAGAVFTAGAGACLAAGAGTGFAWSLDPHTARTAYPLLAAALLVLACACDMLDGAIARLGHCGSAFGGFLDSTVDRFSDFAVWAGIACYYATPGRADPLMALLSMLAMFHGFGISYAKARAETLIPSFDEGYWQRGERLAAVLIATFGYNMPALLWQQATLPAFTMLRRVVHVRSALTGRPAHGDIRSGPLWRKCCLWLWPRMSVPYDVVTGLNIAWLIFALR